MDNGGDELTQALQAQFTQISTQYNRRVDLSAKTVLCAVQHDASVQKLDALRQLEQGSTSCGVGSVQRAFWHFPVSATDQKSSFAAKV